MNEMIERRYNTISVTAALVCLLFVFAWPVDSQTASFTSPKSSFPPQACKDGASPGVIQLTPDPTNPNKLALARKHFYLYSSPFNLANNVNLKTAPALKAYYNGVGASPQFIEWLTENNCETIYCRELTAAEVTCSDSKKCVPEFITAYRNALAKLNRNQELARKWITNYEPLSSAKLRTGFFEAKTEWLKGAVEAIEKGAGNDSRIRSTISDKDGNAFFYDLCPGTYYISSIAPIEIAGAEIFWETAKPIKVEGPPDVNKAVVVTLAFPPGKDKKNFFVGKSVADNSQ
jgi:hypothetical protein